MRSKLYSILSVVCLLCLTSCGVDSSDTTYFTEFVKYNSTETKQETLSESVDLFIDYSTCVAEAKKSAYFKATHPSIVDCSPTFYSIKGKSIKKETTGFYTGGFVISAKKPLQGMHGAQGPQGNHRAFLPG